MGVKNEMLKVVTVKFPVELIKELDSLSNTLGVTRSELIRQAVELLIRDYKRKLNPRPKIVRLYS